MTATLTRVLAPAYDCGVSLLKESHDPLHW